MSQITNIVLSGNTGRTQSYMIKLLPSQDKAFSYGRTDWSDIDPNHIVVYQSGQDSYLCNIKNDWYVGAPEDDDMSLGLFPSSVLRLYFPDYSVDTYDKGCQYILTAYVVIAGTKVELGSFLFKRNESLACPPVQFGSSDKYYEYIDFTITNPFDIQNEAEAYVLRRMCGKGELQANDISSELFITLQVVENIGDHYIKKVGWTNNQNSIQIVDYQDLKLNLYFNKEGGSIDYKILFNTKVTNELEEYIKKTYDVHDIDMRLDCVVMDDIDAYIAISEWVSDMGESIQEEYLDMFHAELTEGELYKDFWNSYKEGVWIKGSLAFVNKEAYRNYRTEDYEPFVTVFSNAIPITQDVYARMKVEEDYEKINFADLNMENKNITIINKTVQEITTVTPNDSTKSHIIQPIFYQTRNISKVIIHPEVTENICINLDSYKSNVNTFSIKIENGVFGEIGRTSKGVVFKVVGNELPNQVKEGTLYVLDQDGVLVTSGKYIYA